MALLKGNIMFVCVQLECAVYESLKQCAVVYGLMHYTLESNMNKHRFLLEKYNKN